MPKTFNKFKKQPSSAKIQKFLSHDRQVAEYIQYIQQENNMLKTNPDTVVGQILPQLQAAVSQNKRLSVLAASLIEAAGGSVTVSKAMLESFESKVLSIKWEVPEGVEDVASASDFVFKYEAVTPEEAESVAPEITIPLPVDEVEAPAEPVPEPVESSVS